jgi:hypothetical protein
MGRFIICTHPQNHLANQVNENEVGGACGMHGRREKCVQNSVGKPEGKKPLGKPRRRWEMGSEWILGRVAGEEMHSVSSG